MNEKHYCKNDISLDIFWQNIPLFMELARQKNFSKTSEILGLSVSTLFRRIKILETSLGISLFVRNTRNVILTAEGDELFTKCVPVMQGAQEIFDSGTQTKNSVTGTVRISMFSEMYTAFIAPEIPRFVKQWPGIQLALFLTDKPTDLHTEPVDLDIRIGEMPNSNLSARRLTSLELVTFASPALFAEHPMPREPEDLATLPCLTLAHKGNPWLLTRGNEARKIMINARHTSNNVTVIKDLALAGLGAVLLRQSEAQEFIDQGKLVRILPEWRGLSLDVNLLWANSMLTTRVRVVKDFLCEVFAKVE